MPDVSSFMAAEPSMVEAMNKNSLMGALGRAQDLQTQYYKNQKLSKLLPFVEPMSQQELQRSQMQTQYYPSQQQAEINKANATAQNQAAAAALESGQASNLSKDQLVKLIAAAPPYLAPSIMAQFNKNADQNPYMQGTDNPNYQSAMGGAPKSAMSGYPQQLSQQDLQAAQGITPSAMAAGVNGQRSQMTGLPAPSDLPVQYPPQSAMAGGQPSQAQHYKVADITPDMQNMADLAQQQSVGSSGAREAFMANIPAYNSAKDVNSLIMHNPGAITAYSGVGGPQKFAAEQLAIKSGMMKPTPEFSTMQTLQNTYGKITPDQLAKQFTNTGTINNVNSAAQVIRAAFNPGATELQTLNGMSEIMNLQAMDMQKKAQQGNMGKDYQQLTGVPVDRDFSKMPLVPDMTRGQAEVFMRGKSEKDRERYMPGLIEMLGKTNQMGSAPNG